MAPLKPPGWHEPVPGWKTKIRLRERLEEPHVTIIGPDDDAYRFGLRSEAFLDKEPPPRRVPDELITHIRQHLSDWKRLWNEMYPTHQIEIP